MEKGVKRWIVDVSEWNPSPNDFSLALAALPQLEHSCITRFVREEDRKRALVSRLLQYSLVREVLQIPYDEIVIKRTLEGKPYLECDNGVQPELPNFNFNVSHHGDYVAIASEPLCLVGIDIVSCDLPINETVQSFIQAFESYFSRFEWENINKVGSPDETLAEFYRYWSLKEAYVKAIGSGLSNGIDRVEFRHNNWMNISVLIDGKRCKEWSFWLHELPKRHWLSIARGHPKAAWGSYKATLKRTEFSQEVYENGLRLPNAGVDTRTVDQLVRTLARAK
ncbi:unnamed protein product [Linum trigynum]|uniref:holo-[acyl-carrier-protein] synthase n=1 Tax=Linum trigynum TaxID=586398 RepID=A0AAV2FT23_9ROSI